MLSQALRTASSSLLRGRSYGTSALATISVTAVSRGSRTDVSAGTHKYSIDEPIRMGGTDSGPNPLAYLLGSLAGCETVTAIRVAKELNVPWEEVTYDVAGDFDPRGFAGVAGVQPHFQKITVNAKVKTTATEAQVQEVARITSTRCPVHSLIHAAKVDFTVNWSKL
eukprot:TRINITY_DN3618_c0_g1_i2.p1 TRINITY_DN3618_c0_g1~~TRINITY_DN3618_c0_g1_i2.p1  ORF type:complete len:167 (+),score=62.04 TRINITY_DN3618_c0_g1_i2:534-1034(+)